MLSQMMWVLNYNERQVICRATDMPHVQSVQFLTGDACDIKVHGLHLWVWTFRADNM